MKSIHDEGAAPTHLDGVLVVDKPAGMTSHDVVARVRRLLGTRRVGHAGTLDPLATGVLVVLVGEATKLGAYLTAQHKRYQARVAFGRATDTLDAEGVTTSSAEAPPWLRAEIAAPGSGSGSGSRIAAALDAERARREQVPPAYSAIQVEGKRSYDRARAGEAVDLAARPVTIHALRVTGGGVPAHPAEPFLDLEIDVSKGYYVRSLARDVGEHLGVPAHLAALRRTSSGPFTLARAARLDDGADALRAALQPLAEAAAEALPIGQLTLEGASRTRQGKRLTDADFAAPPPFAETSAWLDAEGRLAAIGARVAPDSATDPAMGAAGHDGGDPQTPGFVIYRGFIG